MKIPFAGGCACGAIRYQCTAAPIAMLKCHCRDCQRVSGSPHVCAVLIPRRAFTLTQGTLQHHLLPNAADGMHKRGFCPACGSRVTGGEDQNSSRDFIGVTVGSLDDPSWFKPTMELRVSDALTWDPPTPGIPSFAKPPPPESTGGEFKRPDTARIRTDLVNAHPRHEARALPFMNIWALLLALGFMGSALAGAICLTISAVKRSWQGALWSAGSTLAVWGMLFAFASLVGSASDLRLHRPVASAEVIGTWELSAASVAITAKNYRDKPYQPEKGTVHQLELRADGTCRYRSLLEWSTTHYVDCTGTWQVQAANDTKDITELHLQLNTDHGYGLSLEFGEEQGRLFIWSYWDDPDGGDILRYNRLPK